MSTLPLRVSLYSIAATIFGTTAYVVGITFAPAPTNKVSDEHRRAVFERIAPAYETKTKAQEFYLGIGRIRRRVLKDALGDVLEVGAGTGTNIGLYPSLASDRQRAALSLVDGSNAGVVPGCRSVLLCDRAKSMVDAMDTKIRTRLGYRPQRADILTSEIIATSSTSSNEAASPSPPVTSAASRQRLIAVDDHRHASTIAAFRELVDCIRRGVPSSPPAVDKGPSSSSTSTTVPDLPSVAASAPIAEQHEDRDKEEVPPALASSGASPLYRVATCPVEMLPFPDDTFDTVVDMFGLCSFDDPVQALKEMSRVCKPTGKIILVEHGKGTSLRINNYLDKWAPRHADHWGCWWNRDIRRYVRLAGVQVTVSEEKHFGTTHVIYGKPFKPRRTTLPAAVSSSS